MKTHLIYDRLVIDQVMSQLRQYLVLGIISIRLGEDALHSYINEPDHRVLEQGMGLGVLELKQVEIPFMLVKMESVKPIVVAAEGDLINGLLPRHIMFLLQVQQTEVVFANSPAVGAQVRIGLIDESIIDHVSPLGGESGPAGAFGGSEAM
jgi:hypothetical protein